MMRWILFSCLALCSVATQAQVMSKEVIVPAGISAVWHAWTTVEGLKFVSPQSNVELRPGGAYEWFLHLDPDDHGVRGSAGSTVLALVPEDILVFDWTFPPSVPELRERGARTQVVIRFESITRHRTRVRLDVNGWQDGKAWEQGWNYFDQAWNRVLSRLWRWFDDRLV